MPVYDAVLDLEHAVDRELALVAGFLRIRDSQLSVIPSDAALRGRAFPTPRTWHYAARLSAFAQAVGASKAVRRLLVAGCLGEAVAHEYLAWTDAQDLPDPELLLADVDGFDPTGLRPDRAYVLLQAVLGAVARRRTPERWTAAVRLCAKVGGTIGIDAAVPVVRSLLRGQMRPDGAAVPADITVFAPALTLAGLLPEAS
jgi:hypothetical protein